MRKCGNRVLWKMREIEFLQICMSFERQTATEKVGLATYSETAVTRFFGVISSEFIQDQLKVANIILCGKVFSH
jgi:hypothetical protein